MVNSGNIAFGTGMADGANFAFAVSVQRNYFNADIGVSYLRTCDYKLLTDGYTFDTRPLLFLRKKAA